MGKLVDVDVLKVQDFQDFSPTDVMYAIDHCPAVDAVAVIRCKECKHARMYCFGMETEPTLACCEVEDYNGQEFVRFASAVNPDGFCSYGERMCRYEEKLD